MTGGAEHVQDVPEPLARVPDDGPGHPVAGPAHQGQRPRAHRRGGAHVHQQFGHAYQVPRVQVRGRGRRHDVTHRSENTVTLQYKYKYTVYTSTAVNFHIVCIHYT